MEERLVEVEELRKAHKKLKEDIRSGLMIGLGMDKPISSEKLAELHRRITEDIDAYEKTNELIHLARIHDRAEDFHLENMFSMNAIELNQFLKEKFAKSLPIRELKAVWAKVDKNNLVISLEASKQLINLSQIGFEQSEFSGGARVVKKGERFFVEPAYSNLARSPVTFPAHYENFLATKSHLLWHTHPVSANQLRLSFGDRKVSEMSGVPIMVVASSPSGQTVLEINVGKKVYPVKIAEK